MRIKLGKLAVQRNIKEGLFRGGADRVNHCCMKCTRSMASNANGGLLFYLQGNTVRCT